MFGSSFRLSNWMDLIERVQYQAVPGKEPAPIRFMRNLGGKIFLTEDGFIGLFNFLKYKMVSLLHILKQLFLLPEIIFMVPELKMTFTVSNAELTHTYTVFILTVKIWNEIGPALRQAPSLIIFKSNTLKLIRPEKKNVFIIHEPKGIKRLFQLRVGVSPLRHHKKRHNFKMVHIEKKLHPSKRVFLSLFCPV